MDLEPVGVKDDSDDSGFLVIEGLFSCTCGGVFSQDSDMREPIYIRPGSPAWESLQLWRQDEEPVS